MTTPARRTVLTGIGVLTSIGLTPESVRQSLMKGQSGVRPIKSFDTSGLPVRFAGEIDNFDAKSYLGKAERKGLRMMARTIQLAVAGAQLALDDGKVDKTKLDPTRFGVEYGSALIATELDELADAAKLCSNCQPGAVDLGKWGNTGLPAITPLWMLKYLPNMLACHVSMLHNAQGPSNTITENDVAGLLAIGESFRIIKRNGADLFLVGGAESRMNPLSMSRQCLFEKLSRRNDAPEKACRPFDRDRDGVVLGEGAGVFVLEDLDHARRRNARIYAEVVGFGSAFDPIDRNLHYRTGAGLTRAIRNALREANIGPEEIDHINAHGLSTEEGDSWEARGIHGAFSHLPTHPPVFAPKSYFGSLGAGGAPAELTASVLALQEGVLPQTLNYQTPDPACPVTVAATQRRIERPYALKISCTPMGQCAALIVKKWDGASV